jgi:hypothetical protein
MRGSAALSPRVVLVTIGKKVMMAAITTLVVMPKPSQMLSRGTIAMIGTAFEMIT